MRVQLALNVPNLDDAVEFYSKLFCAEPHKRRPGYANFSLDAPPLKLVLFENPDASERLNHLGVEVFDAPQLSAAAARLNAAGIAEESEQGVTCCHATQDKVWASEPGGLRWEWYRITDDAPKKEAALAPTTTCCAGLSAPSCCAD